MNFLSFAPLVIALALFACAGSGSQHAPQAAPAPLAEGENTRAAPEETSAPPLTLDYDQLLMAAQSYLDSSRPTDAAGVAADATRMDPNRPDAYAVWGRAMAQEDQLAEAAQHYEQARAHGSRDAALFAELASVYDVSKRYPEALAVYRDYLTDHPDDAAMRDELALTLLLVNLPNDAVKELRIATQKAPTSPQLRQDLGYALLHAGQFSEARDALEPVVKSDPRRTDATRFLAQAYLGLGDKAHAKALLTQLVAANPHDRQAAALMQNL